MNKPMFNVNFAPQQEPAPVAPIVAEAAPAPDFGESLYLQLLQHEGTRQYSYKDRDGRSIGIGFNLNDKDNQRILAAWPPRKGHEQATPIKEEAPSS